MVRPAIILLLALPLGACRTSTGRYFHNRLEDTLDALPVSVAWGPGLYASARATRYLGTAVGAADTSRFGWVWRERANEDDPPTSPSGFASVEEGALGILVGWERWGGPTQRVGNVLFVVPKKPKGYGENAVGPSDLLDLELEVHLALVGLRAGISLVQLADWLLGWFTADFLHDDRPVMQKAMTRPALGPASQAAKSER